MKWFQFRVAEVVPVFLLVHLMPVLLAAGKETSGQSRPPHIIIMLADDLGWGDVGFHGSQIPTPHLDKLAKSGARLEQFYVQPVCSPTRGALLTGRYPMRLGLQVGVVRPWAMHGLPLEELTLPEALREAGYVTAICGKWHLGHGAPKYLPTRRGFDHQYGHYNGALDYFTHIRDGGHDWHRDDSTNYDEGYATDLIAKAAIEVLSGHDQSKPLFLYVPFNAPHTPLQAPEDWISKFDHIKDKQRRIYAAMVASMDAAVGRILGGLDERGFDRKNTLVFFCSDNGGLRFLGSNGPFRSQKGRLYEGGVRVPAIVSWPGKIKEGQTVDEPLHIVDLYPTFLNLAGANPEQERPLDGRDFWPVLTKGALGLHGVILHNVTPWSGALRMGKWKLVHNGAVPANATEGPAKDTWELFDMEADPSEKIDRSNKQPEVFVRMKRRLELFRKEAVPPNTPPNQPPAGFTAPKVWGEVSKKE